MCIRDSTIPDSTGGNDSGALFAAGVTAKWNSGQSAISVGNEGYNWDHPSTGSCRSGYGTSQILDANGDGLADIVQVENGEIVLYVRQGQQPGLLNSITDGLGNATKVEYRPITDPNVHERAGAADCSWPQNCYVRGKWIVKTHTLAKGTPVETQFSHTYKGAREDV